MAKSEETDAGKPSPPEGLSAFVTKVLDQLAVTAWLPAAMLIGIGSLLVQLHASGDVNVPAALQRLATQPWGTIIILIFGLVLTTMVTQAFSFEAIRLLEGYWAAWGFGGWLSGRAVRRQSRKRQKRIALSEKLERNAFESARGELLRTEDRDYVEIIEDRVYRVPATNRRHHDQEMLRAAGRVNWREKADPHLAFLLSRSYASHAEFPTQPHRLLPSRLGNVIRAAEDQLGMRGQVLEGFVMRNYSQFPARLMLQHDQFRNRLEMYGNLVFVFGVLAVASIPLLAASARYYFASAGAAGLLWFLSWVSYRAAVSSGRGYGAVLVAMSDYLATPRETPASDVE